MNSTDTIRKLAEWGLDKGIIVDLEIEPQVYFLLNNTYKAAHMVEDLGMSNVFVNLDIGHFALNREPPSHMEKLKGRIIQVHLSDTHGLEHTNSILGTGYVRFPFLHHQSIGVGNRTELRTGRRAVCCWY